MTGICSCCLQKLLTKQLGYQVIAENNVETEKGELVGVSMEGRNLTVILKVENRSGSALLRAQGYYDSSFDYRFRCLAWVKRLEFPGELPKGSVSSVTSKEKGGQS